MPTVQCFTDYWEGELVAHLSGVRIGFVAHKSGVRIDLSEGREGLLCNKSFH